MNSFELKAEVRALRHNVSMGEYSPAGYVADESTTSRAGNVSRSSRSGRSLQLIARPKMTAAGLPPVGVERSVVGEPANRFAYLPEQERGFHRPGKQG